jgi:hypothetical protein
MAKGLASPTGYYKDAKTIGETASVYAPVGARNDPRGLNNGWAKGVSRHMDDLEKSVGASASSSARASSTGTGGTTASGATAAAGSTTGSGADGTAQITSTKNAGARNQLVSGKVTVNGNNYDFNSGGHGRGSLPKGDYQVTPFKNSTGQAGMVRDGVGFSFAMSDKFDSRVGDKRTLLRIHPDGGSVGTNGCLGIVGNAATLKQFRDDMNAEIRRNGGSYTLRVQ